MTNEPWKEKFKWMVDAGIITFTKYATFVDGPYLNQEKEVEHYFKRITVTATDPADREKDGAIPVKIGGYELIEGTDGQYKWMGWK